LQQLADDSLQLAAVQVECDRSLDHVFNIISLTYHLL